MPSISVSDPTLRKLHRIDTEVLSQKISEYQGSRSFALGPVKILSWENPAGDDRIIVADGTHRVQACIELDVPTIECVEVTLAECEADARQRGVNLQDLLQRATPFERMGLR
jgi:hypothetical protein